MPRDDHDDHVTGEELDRSLTGVTTAIEIGFQGVHRRFDEQGARMTRIEQTAADVKQTLGAHGAEIGNLARRISVQEKRGLGYASSAGPIATAANEDTKPAITFGDLKRLANAGRVVWPIVAGAGSALFTWIATRWGQ